MLLKTNPGSYLHEKARQTKEATIESSIQSVADDVAALPAASGVLDFAIAVSQTGTAAPTSTDIKNDIGVFTWARTGAGVYTATKTGAFEGFNVLFQPLAGLSGTTQFFVTVSKTSVNVLTVTVKGSDGNAVEAVLSDTTLNIKLVPEA